MNAQDLKEKMAGTVKAFAVEACKAGVKAYEVDALAAFVIDHHDAQNDSEAVEFYTKLVVLTLSDPKIHDDILMLHVWHTNPEAINAIVDAA